MLRELTQADVERAAPPHPGLVANPRAPLRLLLLPQGDARLAALAGPLAGLGVEVISAASGQPAPYDPAAAPPDVLLTPWQARAAVAQDWLALWPALRALYVVWVPGRACPALLPRERVLAAPFSAADLAASLASLLPGRLPQAPAVTRAAAD